MIDALCQPAICHVVIGECMYAVPGCTQIVLCTAVPPFIKVAGQLAENVTLYECETYYCVRNDVQKIVKYPIYNNEIIDETVFFRFFYVFIYKLSLFKRIKM